MARGSVSKGRSACLRRATPGSAMLLHSIDAVIANAGYASSRLRFGASPHQIEDEDDDEDEYEAKHLEDETAIFTLKKSGVIG